MLENISEYSIVSGNTIAFQGGIKLINKNMTGQDLTMLNFFKGTINHSCIHLVYYFLTSRSIIIEGPLVLNDDLYITELLIKEYCKNLKRDIIYSEFKNLFDTSQSKQVFIKNKVKYEEHLNIIIDV